MWKILQPLISAGVLFGLAQLQGTRAEGARMLKRKLGGVLFLFLALQLVFLALIFLAVAFFLALAGFEFDYSVKPALITAAIIFAIAVVLFIEGIRWLKK